MPNYCMNIITAPDEVLDAIIKDGKVDFNTLIPTPPDVFQGDINGSQLDDPNCWYKWNRDHWGTKWNARDTLRELGQVTFLTAWSPPTPFYKALAEHFKNVQFEILYCDEDLNNRGCYFNSFDHGLRHAEIDDDLARDMWGCEENDEE